MANDTIRMECGATANVGDRVYNYYDMEPGTIASAPDDQGWFKFQSEVKSSRTILNGQRVCSIEFARRRGFKGV